VNPADDVLRELRRRARARTSLHTYALSIDIPTVPFEAPCPDEELLGPASMYMASHHAAILAVLERTMNRFMGRCMIFAPPGSAKSLYTSVVAPTWEMGRKPGTRILLTSYQSTLAERQSRRAMSIVEQQKWRDLWLDAPALTKDAAGEWALSNKSEMLAMGLLGGLTGNRCNGGIIDDPVSGREDADSEPMRIKTLNAYKDDFLSRLLPGAWIAFIMTRWHENDLAGSLLPDDYKGESGMIRCKDGLMWEILNIPAKCEHGDDPLGRKVGEYIWPEFYPPEHWAQYEEAQGAESARTWSSLYQQRPAPQGDGRLDENILVGTGLVEQAMRHRSLYRGNPQHGEAPQAPDVVQRRRRDRQGDGPAAEPADAPAEGIHRPAHAHQHAGQDSQVLGVHC
jgi:hypothetical protein